jgi:Tfp pilus assembly protein PilF
MAVKENDGGAFVAWAICKHRAAVSLSASPREPCPCEKPARTSLNKSIRLRPEDARAHVIRAGAYDGRSSAYMAKRDYRKAIADATRVIELDPKRKPAYSIRVHAYVEIKRFDEAAADCTKHIHMLSWGPEMAEVCSLRAHSRQLQGKLDEAIADLTMAVAIDPQSAELLHERGVVYQAHGENAKAKQDFEQAKKLGYR